MIICFPISRENFSHVALIKHKISLMSDFLMLCTHFSSVFILFRLSFFHASDDWRFKITSKAEISRNVAGLRERIFNLKRRNLELLGWSRDFIFYFYHKRFVCSGQQCWTRNGVGERRENWNTRGKKRTSHTKTRDSLAENDSQPTANFRLHFHFDWIHFSYHLTEIFSSLGWMSCDSKIATKSRAREKSQL